MFLKSNYFKNTDKGFSSDFIAMFLPASTLHCQEILENQQCENENKEQILMRISRVKVFKIISINTHNTPSNRTMT